MFKELEEFGLCTQTLFDGDSWDISCKLGLWSVSCGDKDQAQDEALHYFRQYKSDGEYSSIIGGKSAGELLLQALYN
tara:strand:+ start:309 stop:539 length:231 start_codon:yes stop_codon:yes gene_type:complete